MAHITVEIDDVALAQLQVIAARRQTTVEAMVGIPDHRDR